MKYLVLFLLTLMASTVYSQDFSHLETLSTMANRDGKQVFIKCPDWDWSLIPNECKSKFMISFNCLPRCGKYPDDKPDIGAFEYFPGKGYP